ncbi:MAG: glycosyltransferase [Polymorphobacter sp.]|uniref:glycosyltransferase n=1 Tax=Polymorphobacter sp. TaxID=1909290 RepID=UPI003A85461B
MKSLYANASAFTLLSRQEAAAVVFAEASSYGLPSVAFDTGGVSTLVKDGDNGLLFSLDTPIEAIADKLGALLRDPQAHAEMRVRARTRFETKLNWSSWGDTAARTIEQAIAEWPAKAAWLHEQRLSSFASAGRKSG